MLLVEMQNRLHFLEETCGHFCIGVQQQQIVTLGSSNSLRPQLHVPTNPRFTC